MQNPHNYPHATPLNKRQIGLWLFQQKHPKSSDYNISTSFKVTSNLSIVLVKKMITRLFDLYPAFRTKVFTENGTPMQNILSKWDSEVEIHKRDLALTLEEQLEEIAQVPFNFDTDFLSKIHLIEVQPGVIIINLLFHHMIADGATGKIIADTLNEIFLSHFRNESAFNKQHDPEQYFTAIQLHEPLTKPALEYWDSQLNGINLSVDLGNESAGKPPVSYAQPEKQDKDIHPSRAVNSHDFRFSSTLSQQINQFSRAHKSTVFCFISAIYGMMLNRCFRVNDFAIGYVRDVRPKSEVGTPGYFIENSPLPFSFNNTLSGIDLLQSLRNDLLDHRKVGNVSAAALLDHLRQKNHSKGGELNVTIGQTMFSSYQFSEEQKRPDFEVEPLAMRVGIVDTDLTLMLDTLGEEIRFRIHYDTALFTPYTVKMMEQTLRHLADQMLNLGDTPIHTWNLVPQTKHQALQQGHAYLPKPFPAYNTFYDIFAQKAHSHAHNVAIIDGEQHYSYQDVFERVNLIANQLYQAGVRSGDNVALCLERGMAMIASILAIHKLGAAYVPLDPTFPQNRLETILDDSQAKCVVAQDSSLAQFKTLNNHTLTLLNVADLLAYDDNQTHRDIEVQPSGPLAVIIYTSGSTGKPKGVEVKHEGLINTLFDFQERCPMQIGDKILFKENYIFDASIWGLFSWFIGEGRVVILPNGQERDIEFVNQFAEQQHITHLFLTPSMLTASIDYFAAQPHSRMFPTLRHLYVGAEKFPRTTLEKIKQLQISHLNILNLYGPTEASIYCSAYPVLEWQQNSLNIPIGKPTANMRHYIVDENMKLLPPGFAGELCVSGRALAAGYRNLPEKTRDVFLENPFLLPSDNSDEFSRLYRTGDLVRLLEDGNIEYLGRIDTQVKIRGLRIELGEIEEHLRAHKHINEAVAVVKQTKVGPTIAAYYTANHALEHHQIKSHLGPYLPAYMIPQHFQSVPQMPTTASGKLDRKHLENLPLAIEKSVPSKAIKHAVEKQENLQELESRLSAIWQDTLQREDIGHDDSFFDLGGHSLLITVVTQKIEQDLGLPISVTDFFRFPTIRELSQFLSSSHDVSHLAKTAEPATPTLEENEPIAVIGVACRYPGANDVNTFWQNLVNGVEGIREFSTEELAASPEPYAVYSNKNFVKRKGVINNPAHFDASFFGYSPKEAMIIDPQQRLFLEEAYHALEDGGYSDIQRSQHVGVYGGAGFSSYTQNLADYAKQGRGVTDYQIMMGNANDFLCTRVAYKLNLSGPAITLQTACSTSLVAVERACSDLRAGRCEMALAGGVSLISGIDAGGYTYQEGMIMSPDGHCRTFDAKAKGTVPSQGVGVVLLKPLSKALADGDPIRAVIAGAAVNNDGNAKIGYTAPGVEGQKDVIRKAQQNAGVSPSDISYIEAHGTATPMGDPIELAALSLAFKENETPVATHSCAIGSVKSNLGHCDAAAGIAGFIKTVLCLQHETLVPSLHYNTPNPDIDFENSPFKVNTQTRPWTTQGITHEALQNAQEKADDPSLSAPLRAGVSAFGIGGTNAHIVLEQAPAPAKKPLPAAIKAPLQVALPVSGASPESLQKNMDQLQHFLKDKPAETLPNIAATLQTTRVAQAFRACAFVEVKAAQQGQPLEFIMSHVTQNQKPQPVFVFAGGYEHATLVSYLNLYRTLPLYAQAVKGVFDEFIIPWEYDIDTLAGYSEFEFSRIAMNKEQRQLMAIVMEVGLAHFYNKIGIKCDAVVGSGFGQYAATCFAGAVNINEMVEHILYLQATCEQQIMIANPRLPLGLSTQGHALDAKETRADLTLCSLNINSSYNPKTSNIEAAFGLTSPALVGTLHQMDCPSQSPIPHQCRYVTIADTTEEVMAHLQTLLSQLWVEGININWRAFYGEHHPNKVNLFGYQFDSHEFYARSSAQKAREAALGQEQAPQSINTKAMQSNQVKDKLTDIWVNYFDHSLESLDSSFFDLGGESIMGLSLIDDINEVFDLSLPSNVIYEASTLNELSEFVFAQLEAKQDGEKAVSEVIAQIWKAHLEVNEIDEKDDFFAMGGDSIIALGLVDDINQAFSTDIASNSLYDTPTLAQLIQKVEQNVQNVQNSTVLSKQNSTTQHPAPKASHFNPLVLLQAGSDDNKRPIFLVHAAGGGLIQFSNIVKKLGSEFTVYGFESPPELPQNNIEGLAHTYVSALLQAYPNEREFILGGHSFGPVVALEMAHQLIAKGYDVTDMLLIDPPGPNKMPQRAETYDDILLHLNDGAVALDTQKMAAMSLDEKVSYFKSACGDELWRKRFYIITPTYVKNFKKQLDMMFEYHFKPIHCNATYFEASDTMPLLPHNMHEGWSGLIQGRFSLKPISGNHISMIDDPGAAQIVDGIFECFYLTEAHK